jgi:hypothetical protein
MELITAEIRLGDGLTVPELKFIEEHGRQTGVNFDSAAVNIIKAGIRALSKAPSTEPIEQEAAK